MFPANARSAFVDVQRIASTSVSGKLAARVLAGRQGITERKMFGGATFLDAGRLSDCGV